MDGITTENGTYSNPSRNIHSQSTLPKSSSAPSVQIFNTSDQPHYSTPPTMEQPREIGPEIHDIPATILPKRIYLTSSNEGKDLRVSWAMLILELILACVLLILGAYEVIEAYRDTQDAPITLLSESVATAPAPAVSLYYEAVSILQLALIALFTGGLGLAAYFPHGIRQSAKLGFIIFTALSTHIGLNQISLISEEIAHKINLEIYNDSYRIAELSIIPFILIFLLIASYPACATFLIYKFEKQSNKWLRILYFMVNIVSILIFIIHTITCGIAVYGGYNSMYVSRFSATVRLSYAISAYPASIFGIFLASTTLKPILSGSRPVGVWAAILGAAAILVMYNTTALLAGMFQDTKGDVYESAYLVQFVMHCSSIIAWTGLILVGVAFAYVR